MAMHPSLWGKLDLQNCQQASSRLSTLSDHYKGALKVCMWLTTCHCLSLHACCALQEVNLEFAVDVTDHDLQQLRGNKLEILNLNACQRSAALSTSVDKHVCEPCVAVLQQVLPDHCISVTFMIKAKYILNAKLQCQQAVGA